MPEQHSFFSGVTHCAGLLLDIIVYAHEQKLLSWIDSKDPARQGTRGLGSIIRLAVSARRVMSRRDRLAGQRSKGSLRNRGNAFLGSLNLSQKGNP